MSSGDASPRRRIGRPPKVDATGTPTRERLLAAGARSFVDNGFEATRLADVARMADVSTPAIYTHFPDKDQFLLEVAWWSLQRVGLRSTNSPFDPVGTVHRYLSDDFSDTRRLLSELHLASTRNDRLAELLQEWHHEHALAVEEATGLPRSSTKALYLLLLGLCQADAMGELGTSDDELIRRVEQMVTALLDVSDEVDRSDEVSVASGQATPFGPGSAPPGTAPAP